MDDWMNDVPVKSFETEEIPLLSHTYVTISEDRMTCVLNLASPENGISYRVSDIVQILNDNDVKQGIDKEKIQEIIDKRLYFKDVVVANGKLAVDGEDGYFTFHFRTEMPVLPKIMNDGSVDYKNMDLFEEVKNGQLLCEYTNATPGGYGYTVLGELLKPRRGKELPTIHGAGFVMSEDKKKYFAAMDGRIEFKNNRMEIKRLYVIEGDVDSTTGNISFSGDVCVKGCVRGGYVIRAGGNVVVEGHVEAAEIYAGKSILLKKGNQGNQHGILHAKKSVSGMFFESVIIRAVGTINANYLLNCDVATEDKLVVAGKRGVIIGGITKARGGITCYALGNIAEIPTEVQIGIDASQREKYHEIGKKITKVTSEITLFEEGIRKVALSPVQNDDTKTMYRKLMQALLIKQQEKEKYLQERKQLMEVIQNTQNAKVVVHGVVYPGTTVQIDTNPYVVQQAYKQVEFVRRGEKVEVQSGDD